jgi:hypothetical protein
MAGFFPPQCFGQLAGSAKVCPKMSRPQPNSSSTSSAIASIRCVGGASAPQRTGATASGARATCTDVGEASFSAYRVVMWARWMTGAQSAGWDRGPGWPTDGWRWVYTMMCSPFSEGDGVRRLGRVLGRTGAGGAVNAEPGEKWRRIFGREPARECPGRVRRARSAQPPPTAPATTRPLRRSGPLPTGFNGLTAHAQ